MNKILLLIIVVIMLFESCSSPRYIYSPSTPNIAYFKNKGDSKLNANYSIGNNNYGSNTLNNGIDIQAAYALTNHWYINSGLFKRSERESYNGNYNFFDTSTVNYVRNIIHAGVGYFIQLNKRKTITFYNQLDIGFGKFKIHDYGLLNGNNYDRNHSNNITNYLWQGGFNFMPAEVFRFSFTGKFSWVQYGNNNTTYTSDELSYFGLDKISNNTLSFWEPSFDMQFQVPSVKGLFINTSLTICNKLQLGYPKNRDINFSMGLTADINKIFKSKR